MSKGLDPDQDQNFEGPHLGPNCYQQIRFSADDSRKKKALKKSVSTFNMVDKTRNFNHLWG